MVKTIVDNAYHLGIREIVIGNIKGIRSNNNNSNNNNNYNNTKVNAMVNNFWSYAYIVRRIKDKAEEYGIKVKEVNEYNTSSICIRCNSSDIVKRGRLFRCLNCRLEAHRDAIGVLNIAYNNNNDNMANLYSNSKGKGIAIRVMAHPLLLRWDGMRWEPRRAMNNQPMNILEAGILTL
jgi:putative transposase